MKKLTIFMYRKIDTIFLRSQLNSMRDGSPAVVVQN
jgi:hypothetical protein